MRNAAAVTLFTLALAGASSCRKPTPKEAAQPVAAAPVAAPAQPKPPMDRRPAALEGSARGPANALINIVAFADFQCQYCAQALPTIEEVMKAYPGKVRFFYRHLPLLGVNDDAVPAAEASLAAEAQGKFWEMHDKLFANQKALKRPDLERYAKELGLDVAKFRTSLETHQFLSRIQGDMRAAQELGAKFTPVFFINGRPLGGAQPFKQWALIIDDELAAAQKLMAGGLPADRVYASLVKDAAMPGTKPAAGGEAASSTIHRIPLGRAPARGGRLPKVTLVQYCEFECPYCKSAQPTLKRVLDTYGDDVQLVWKHLPLPMHRNAALAALASEAANAQGKFWEMHDKLFENQGALDRANLDRYAAELGLDAAKFKNAVEVVAPGNVIDGDAQEAMRFGQRGTPAFFVNGRSMVGAQPFETFKAVIDQELKRADAKLAAGVPRARLYEELTKGGVEKADAPVAAHEADRGRPDPNVAYRVALGDAPVRGPKDALVTLVVFSDFECPFCARVEPTLAKVMDTYEGKVRVVWKDFPLSFHPNAMPAALAARAAGAQGKFWEMHDKLFENQRGLDRASLESYAKELGLDLTRFRSALDGQPDKARVLADAQQGATVGVTGTPAFFVNGIALSGALPFESFKDTIDEQLKKAQALVARGTPRSKVYDAIMKTAQTSIVAAARAQPAPTPGSEPVQQLAVGSSPTRGPKDAPITLVLFSDFQCPFCGKVGPTITRLEQEYPGKLRVVWKNFPLPNHPHARPAAAAALAAGAQGKFWQMHDKLFENQGALDRASLENHARALGLDLAKWKAALDSNEYQAAIDADTKQGVAAGVTGTPTSFVNGRKLAGAVPYEAWKTLVDRELARPDRVVAGRRP